MNLTSNNSVSQQTIVSHFSWGEEEGRCEGEDGEEGDEERRCSDYITINWSSDYYRLL